MDKRLTLRREALTELATDDLRGVAGGSAASCITCLDCLIEKTTALLNDEDIPTLQYPCYAR